jgi:predicted Zn-dependent protease
VQDLTLLRGELAAYQGKANEARDLLEAAIRRDPKSVPYRIGLARTLRLANDPGVVKVFEQAERDLGPGLPLLQAETDFWAGRGGDDARAALRKLVDRCDQLVAADRPALLSRLAASLASLGDQGLAAELLRKLSEMEPNNVETLMRVGSLAIEACDGARLSQTIERLRKIENEEKGEGLQGTYWRVLEAASLIEGARRTNSAARPTSRKHASWSTK